MKWKTALVVLVAVGCGHPRSKDQASQRRSKDQVSQQSEALSGDGGLAVSEMSLAVGDGESPDADVALLDAATQDVVYSATLMLLGQGEPVALVERDGDILAMTPSGRVVDTLATRPTSHIGFGGLLVSYWRGPELHMINLAEPTLADVTIVTNLPRVVNLDWRSSDPRPPNSAPDDVYSGALVLRYGANPSLEMITDERQLDVGVPVAEIAALRKAPPTLTPEGREFLRRYPTVRGTVHGTPLPRPALPSGTARLSADAHALPLPRSARRLQCRGVCGKSYALPPNWPLQLVVVGTDYDCAFLGSYPACVWRDPESGRFASMAKPTALARDAKPLWCKVVFDSTFTAYAFDVPPRGRAPLHRLVCTATGCSDLGRFLGWLDRGDSLENVPSEGLNDCDEYPPP